MLLVSLSVDRNLPPQAAARIEESGVRLLESCNQSNKILVRNRYGYGYGYGLWLWLWSLHCKCIRLLFRYRQPSESNKQAAHHSSKLKD